jgi:hypothetical protein
LGFTLSRGPGIDHDADVEQIDDAVAVLVRLVAPKVGGAGAPAVEQNHNVEQIDVAVAVQIRRREARLRRSVGKHGVAEERSGAQGAGAAKTRATCNGRRDGPSGRRRTAKRVRILHSGSIVRNETPECNKLSPEQKSTAFPTNRSPCTGPTHRPPQRTRPAPPAVAASRAPNSPSSQTDQSHMSSCSTGQAAQPSNSRTSCYLRSRCILPARTARRPTSIAQ